MVFIFFIIFFIVCFIALIFFSSLFLHIKNNRARNTSVFSFRKALLPLSVIISMLVGISFYIISRSGDPGKVNEKKIYFSQDENTKAVSRLIAARKKALDNASSKKPASTDIMVAAPSSTREEDDQTRQARTGPKTEKAMHSFTNAINTFYTDPESRPSPKETSDSISPEYLHTLEKGLKPSTSSQNTMPTSPRTAIPPRYKPFNIADITGAQDGDFFVYAYYDVLRLGVFERSGSLKIIPCDAPENSDKQKIKIGITIPRLSPGGTFQLPFLLKGSLRAAPITGVFDVDEAGTVYSISSVPRQYFSYNITRSTSSTKFTSIDNENKWLEKEYDSIPFKILKTLQKGINRSAHEKMRTVADILGNNFVYQTGLIDINLDENRTWTALLDKEIANEGKFPCDCDVLSAYSFIFLKYLGLEPVLLIGFLKTSDSLNSLRSEDLHATIYLRSGSNWMIFEPTFFVEDLPAGKSSREDTGSSDSYITSSRLVHFNSKKRMEDAYKRSSMQYFIPEPEFTPGSGHLIDDLPESPFSLEKLKDLARSIDPLTPIYLKKMLKTKNISALVIKLSLTIYFTALILFKMLLAYRRKKEKIYSLPELHSLVFITCISCSSISIITQLTANAPLPVPHFKEISVLLCMISAFLSLASTMGSMRLRINSKDVLGPFFDFLRTHAQFIAGLSLCAAALFLKPQAYLIATSVLVIKICFDYVRIMKRHSTP